MGAKYTLCLIVFILICHIIAPGANSNPSKDSYQPKITPKIYASAFVRRREEHKLFVKHLKSSNYEKTYKMLDLGFQKILELIEENNATLHQSGYDPSIGFPTENRLQDATAMIIENICLGADIILHFPEMSYRVLRKRPNWKKNFNWGTQFLNNFVDILNAQTYEMIELFRQEVNLTKRSDDFTNPYYTKLPEATSSKEKKEKRKPRKKLKRGPQLTGRVEL